MEGGAGCGRTHVSISLSSDLKFWKAAPTPYFLPLTREGLGLLGPDCSEDTGSKPVTGHRQRG